MYRWPAVLPHQLCAAAQLVSPQTVAHQHHNFRANHL